jgi:hypothetical protein
LVFWLIPHWDYLPEWAPVPPFTLAHPWKLLQSFLLCLLVWPMMLICLSQLVTDLVLLLNRVLPRTWAAASIIIIALIVLGAAATPWLFEDRIDGILVKYAISRYDLAIVAIEKYHEDCGEYPPSLGALFPDYLPFAPGLYMNYGDTLKYDPNSERGYVGHGPFTFELFGTYKVFHGQTLKYCPIEDDSCRAFSRINDRWVWAYSSGL